MASSTQIIIPEDYPEGERFNNAKEKFKAGISRTLNFNGVKAKIFNGELMALFGTPGFELKYATGEPVQKLDLLRAFVEGYSEGKERFNELYSVPPYILLFSNPKLYIETLHLACFHCDPITGREDFSWIKKVSQYPYLFTSIKDFKEKGFYSGLYASVMELQTNYPRPFATFEECPLENKSSLPEGLTNFEKAVWYEYLRIAGYKDNLTATEKHKQYGKNFEMAYNDYVSKRRKPNEAECLKIIAALEKYPDAFELAKSKFDQTETL
jgi:hypothetical protein